MPTSFLTLVLVALAAVSLSACRGESAAEPADPAAADTVAADTLTAAVTGAPAPGCEAPPPGAADAPRSDTLTVLFFGDSLTEGYGLPGGKDEAYPALIGERIAAAGLPARVVNAGISGNTSADGRGRVAWALRQAPPDVFVLALGANDGLRGLSAEAMRANLEAILCAARGANPAVRLVVVGMEAPPNYGAEYTGRYRAVFASLAESFDAAFVPFLLDRVAGVARLNQGDRIHPTPEGHRILAETVWTTLEPVIREAAARPVG